MRTFLAEPVSGQWNIVQMQTGRVIARFPTALSAWAHADELEQKAHLAANCKQLHLSTPSVS
jgi:hypothetical protein